MALVLAFAALLPGCAGNRDAATADKLRESLQELLSPLEGGDDSVVNAMASSVDSESLDSLGMSATEIVGQVIEELDIEVGDVDIDGDVAIAQIYVRCKDIPTVIKDVQALANQYSSSSRNSTQIASQLAQRANDMIDAAETKEFGPIYLEYFHTDEGWALSDESRKRLGAEIASGSSEEL